MNFFPHFPHPQSPQLLILRQVWPSPIEWRVAAGKISRAFRLAWLGLFVGLGLVLAPVAAASAPVSGQRLLDSIVIEQVHLEERPLSEVARYLDELLESYLPDELTLNVLLIDPEDRDPKVNLRLRNVSLAELVDFIALQTGTYSDLRERVLTFSTRPLPEANGAPHLETEIFPISRSAIIRMTHGQ